MKFIILAYNPKYINLEVLEKVGKILVKDFKCGSVFIPHINDKYPPVYCVKYVDR